MSNDQAVSQYLAEYPASSASLPGQTLPWLQQFRKQALACFSTHGFPDIRQEEWRYTNVSAIEKKRFKPFTSVAQGLTSIDSHVLDELVLRDMWTVVLVNGQFVAEHSRLEGVPPGVIICSMSQALEDNPERVQAQLGQAVSDDEHGFIAFNSAWFSEGLYVHVPANTVLEKPLQVVHYFDDADALLALRNVYHVDESAEASIVETFAGAAQAYFSVNVTEAVLAKNASLSVTQIQTASDKAYHFAGCYAKQAANSRFRHDNFAFGGLLARNEIHTQLFKAAECELNGLYLGNKRQHIDNHTRINHVEAHAISRELYKGVLAQRARGVFQGRVIVAEDAQKTDSEMNNRNLLLSEDAEADTKPQLEIYADDVKCAHGVTVGQLDEKSVFYLQSRCMSEEQARNMLTFAFANEMVNKIKHKSLHDFVLKQLLQCFPQQGVEAAWL